MLLLRGDIATACLMLTPHSQVNALMPSTNANVSSQIMCLMPVYSWCFKTIQCSQLIKP